MSTSLRDVTVQINGQMNSIIGWCDSCDRLWELPDTDSVPTCLDCDAQERRGLHRLAQIVADATGIPAPVASRCMCTYVAHEDLLQVASWPYAWGFLRRPPPSPAFQGQWDEFREMCEFYTAGYDVLLWARHRTVEREPVFWWPPRAREVQGPWARHHAVERAPVFWWRPRTVESDWRHR